MPRTSSLAALEQRLASIDAQRRHVISEIASRLRALMDADPMPSPGKAAHAGAAPAKKGKRRKLSAAARAKIAASARRRWAIAKKAGKNRL